MKIRHKKMLAISALTAIIVSQNTAFAQTVFYAEAPLAANISARQATSSTYSEDVSAQLINVNAHFITPAPQITSKTEPKPKLSNSQLDETQWLLKPQADKTDKVKVTRDYSKEFAGLRTSLLADNNTKIGTATQYIEAEEVPFMKANKSSQNLYSKTDDNFLLRAKLDF